jgi:hypothetical protein
LINKLNDLITLVQRAEEVAGQFSGGYSNHFFSAETFKQAIAASIVKLKAGNLKELDSLYLWFAPTCDWDDLIGKDGEALGNEIFSILAVFTGRQLTTPISTHRIA